MTNYLYIYGRENCVYCKQAKILYNHFLKNEYKIVELEWSLEKKTYLECLKNIEIKTLPVIITHNTNYDTMTYIGGYNDFRSWLHHNRNINVVNYPLIMDSDVIELKTDGFDD